ncbi:MAG: hypothetical protein KGL39_00320 [Patescibacteria group bacterium]|nr:hypothetical protein [Patescibacteria group bacterium]
MKVIIPELSWRNNQAVLPCGHPLIFDSNKVNHYGYLMEQKHKCHGCVVEYDYIVLEGWEAEQRQIAKTEGRLQTCPRRMGECGPWEYKEELDFWEKDQWRERSTDVFPEGFPRPRTCSFCGGVHPEDAISLVRLGWEIEWTTKRYKHYLHPPGCLLNKVISTRHMEEWHREEFCGAETERPKARLLDPMPPVKVYVYHFSKKEIEAFIVLV